MEAFAFELYRRYLKGETLSDLARDLGIPEERLEPRVRAAARCWEFRRKSPGEATPFRLSACAGGGRQA
jgi:hypothetical protein